MLRSDFERRILQSHVTALFFPSDTLFIRRLRQADELSVDAFLFKHGVSIEEVEVSFGLFTVEHELLDLFADSDAAFAAAAASGDCMLFWMQ